MSSIGNLIWVVFGGFFSALGWCVAGALMYVSIVGIPWGRACFTMANLALFPFGREAIRRDELTGKSDIGTSGWGLFGNILWFVVGGFWLGLLHAGVGLFYAVTIVGIPFAIAHFKLGSLALAPVGRTIVRKDVAGVARRRSAEAAVDRLRA